MSNNIYIYLILAKFKSKNGILLFKLKCIEILNAFISLLGICISKDIYFSNKYNVNPKLQDDSLEQTQYYYLTDSGYTGQVQ